jgi:hypothetical protein
MKHLFCMCLLLTLVFGGLSAQSISRSIISTAGESSHGQSISLDWTLGEMASSTINYHEGLITEGFQQPTLRVEAITKDEIQHLPLEAEVTVEEANSLQLNAYPNPVSEMLRVDYQFDQYESGFLQLVDAQGKELLEEQVQLVRGHTDLNMAPFAAGSYYLIVRNDKGTIVKALKIIKTL